MILLSVVVFIAVFSTNRLSEAASHSDSGVDAAKEIDHLLSQLEEEMSSSREQIEQGNYLAAQSVKEDSIKTLSILLDLFLPLPERIKELLDKEQKILSQTETFFRNGNDNAETKLIIESQKSNRDNTQKTANSIQRQVRDAEKSATSSNKPTDAVSHKGQRAVTDLLKRVGKLLAQSVHQQDSAAGYLNERKFELALKSVKMAAENLKKALDALKQDQQKSNKQEQQDKGQQQAGDQSTQNKDKNRSGDGEQNDSSVSQKENQSTASSSYDPEKKLTAKEALKELNRLQKEAEAEKRRRERALGRQAVPGRVPIEKDW